jgi:hypothetical protein
MMKTRHKSSPLVIIRMANDHIKHGHHENVILSGVSIFK